MDTNFKAKKIKTPEELKKAARNRAAFQEKTKPVVRRQPKRSVAY